MPNTLIVNEQMTSTNVLVEPFFQSNWPNWVAVLFIFIFGAVAASVFYSLLYIESNVVLNANDIQHASWLSYSLQSFVLGALFKTMMFCAVLIGIGLAVTQRDVVPLLSTACAFALLVSTSEISSASIGIYFDTVKIGCFVEETKQCHQMLNLPSADVPSMFDESGAYTSDYLERRTSLTEPHLSMLPVVGLLWAPYVALHINELNQKIKQQRALLDTKLAH